SRRSRSSRRSRTTSGPGPRSTASRPASKPSSTGSNGGFLPISSDPPVPPGTVGGSNDPRREPMSTKLVSTAFVAVACLAALAAAGVATAATYPVSGKQTVVSEKNGTYKMNGGLIGDWTTTSFKETAKSPIYKGKGTEHFQGCLDTDHNGKCAGD